MERGEIFGSLEGELGTWTLPLFLSLLLNPATLIYHPLLAKVRAQNPWTETSETMTLNDSFLL